MNSPSLFATKLRWSLLVLIGFSAAGFGNLAAQELEIRESVDVRVFNFEVVVTDQRGTPIRGLTKEDFELVIDGESTEIGYFTAFEGGGFELSDDEEVEAGVEAPAGAGAHPLLVVVWDSREVDPGWSKRTLEELLVDLPQLIKATRGVMVIRQGINLETEQVFTSDPKLITSALQRAGSRRMPAIHAGERRALLRRIETADGPAIGMSEGDVLRIEAQAATFLQEIRSYQRLERYALERSAAQLRALVRSLAGLPGRREVLYIGRGFETQPAVPLFDFWWHKYSQVGPAIGVISVEQEKGLETVNAKLLSVIEEANAQRVTFNTFAPGGLIGGNLDIFFSSAAASDAVSGEMDRRRDYLLTLARSTGGVGHIRGPEIKPLLTEMVSGFVDFYSLGFQSTAEPRGRGEVRVAVRGDFRVRHLDRYRAVQSESSLEDLTLSALVTSLAQNPLGLAIDLDEVEPQKDGSRIVPILVKVPIANLALLPEGNRHIGKLRFLVQAQSSAGDLSDPVGGEVPIEITNNELLDSMSRLAGYRLRMRIGEGEQRIAVAVHDDIGGVDSALRVTVGSGATN